MKHTIIAALIALASTAALAVGPADNGNDLLSADATAAINYVAGAGNAAINLGATCPPEGVTNGQVLAMVRKRMQDAPSIRNLNASVIVVGVMIDAWPCKQQTKRPGATM